MHNDTCPNQNRELLLDFRDIVRWTPHISTNAGRFWANTNNIKPHLDFLQQQPTALQSPCVVHTAQNDIRSSGQAGRKLRIFLDRKRRERGGAGLIVSQVEVGNRGFYLKGAFQKKQIWVTYAAPWKWILKAPFTCTARPWCKVTDSWFWFPWSHDCAKKDSGRNCIEARILKKGPSCVTLTRVYTGWPRTSWTICCWQIYEMFCLFTTWDISR